MTAAPKVRTIENLRIRSRGRGLDAPRRGNYDALFAGSRIVFARRDPLSHFDSSRSSGGPADLEALLRSDPKNFDVPLEGVLSAEIKRGIPWTTDSRIVLNLRDARLVLDLRRSSMDGGRLTQAQEILQSFLPGWVEGPARDVRKARPTPPAANAIALLGMVGSALSFIRGGSWLVVGGPATLPGAAMVVSAAWLFAMTYGLATGKRWAWLASVVSFPGWILWGLLLAFFGYPSAWTGLAWYPMLLGYLFAPDVRRFFTPGAPSGVWRPLPGWAGLFAVRHPVAGRLLAGLGAPFGLLPAGDVARASARLAFFGIDAEFYYKRGADIRLLDDAFFLLHSADAARPSPVKNFEALVGSLRTGDFDAYYRALEAADLVRVGRAVEIGGRLEDVQGDLVVDRNAANGTTQLWRLKMLPAPDGDSTAVQVLDTAILRNQLRETATPLGGRLPAGVWSVLRMDARLVPVANGTAIEQMREAALGVKKAFGIHELLVRTSAGDLLG